MALGRGEVPKWEGQALEFLMEVYKMLLLHPL